MKNITYLKLFSCFLIAFSLSFMACQPDDDLPDDTIEFRYDGDNNDAPALPGGTYESAIRIPASYAGNDPENELYAVEYYIKEVPSSASIKIYNGGIISPSSIIYEQNITSDLASESWITHTIASPIILDGSDLWISIEYSYTGEKRVVGCDSGPADPNGDWLNDKLNGLWDSLLNGTGGVVNVNWNIRAKVRLK